MIDLSEYRLETIRKDDEFILYCYCGTRQTDATASSIFVLTPASEHPAVASLRRMEHEYSLQAELDPDWAVIPIGLREHQAPEPPEFIAGTLLYMAPEQNGRMNRSIFSRSDLYAFGIMLYEVLTGGLPFSAFDPMEWVHCHVARQPVPPSERLPGGVPGSVSAIVMKLLAKSAEERYQTAAGLESDLQRCLAQLETQGRIVGETERKVRLLGKYSKRIDS